MNITVKIKSSSGDGELIENNLTFEYSLNQVPREADGRINWPALNGMAIEESFIQAVKNAMTENGVEVLDPDNWTTEAFVVGLDDELIEEDYDFSMLEDRIMTGDLL